ncbi:anks1b [Symbiodinium microadriaticum]|nr:anks1b [Symbiodinium microadriaticum]
MEPSEERRQVLHYAAVHGRADLISLAIEQEIAADPSASPEEVTRKLLGWQNEAKGTALHEACRAGHVDVVRMLLLRGAPANERDALGRAAFQVVSEGPAEKSRQLQAAFEAELFKRCAQGDLAGAEALALGGIDLNCEQAGYSPWAWAELFGQSSVAARMQELASGGPEPAEPAEPAEAPASPGGSASPASAASAASSTCESRPVHLSLWPAMTAYLHDHVCLGGREVAVFLPLLDWTRAASLREELSFCLQALCGEAGCQPRLRVPGSGGSGGSSDSKELLQVDVWMDRSVSTDAYGIAVQSKHLHITAGSFQALYVALESLRQLLKFHGAGESALRLPRLRAWGRCPGLFAIFLELWRLEPREQVLVLRQLRGRGKRQIWAPVPEQNLASIWQIRRTCSELDVELVPILASTASIELLAQFQGCSQIGCRSGEAAELGLFWQRMLAAGLGEGRLAAVLQASGASASRGLEDLACDGIPSSRFAVLLETRLEAASLGSEAAKALKAASRLQCRGVSSGLLVRSPSALPFQVWHWQPLPGTAAALAELTRQAQHAELSEVLLEIPVFGAPWAGPGTAWRPSWCPLFAFLAGAKDAEALEGLRKPSSRQLLLGLFKDAPSEELARELWEGSELPQVTSLSGPSASDFLRSLLELLAGLLPQSLDEDRDGCISSANAWYAHLSERRQRLREFLEGHEAVSQHERAKCELLPESRLLIASALTGVEWLRFSCRLLLLLAKHSEKHTATLHAALQALPPAKGSDVRNGFLSLLHQTSSELEEIETPESEVSLPLQAAKALWRGGLRLGAALDLPPWSAI